MPNYFFFFEISDPGVNKIRNNFRESFISKDIDGFLVKELINERFKESLEIEFNKIIENLKIQQIYYMAKTYGRFFQFICIFFNCSKSISEYTLKQNINDFIKVIDGKPEVTRIDRYFFNIFINLELRNELNSELKQCIQNSDLRSHTLIEKESFTIGDLKPGHLIHDDKPFILEINNFFPLDLWNKLEKLFLNYYNRTFPKFLIPSNLSSGVLIGKYNLCNFRKLEGKEMIKLACEKLNWELWAKIGFFCNRLSAYYNSFYRLLLKNYYRFHQFDGKILSKLINYLQELQNYYYESDIVFPELFLRYFDEVGFKTYIKKDSNIILFDDKNELFQQYYAEYKGLFGRMGELLKEFLNLDNQLNESLKVLNYLVLEKRDSISIFTKQELKEKLDTIQNERSFCLDILIPILYDLGYEEIQFTHGQYEFGIDILFRNKNKLGYFEWNGALVKTGNINFKEGTEISQKIREISRQIHQGKLMNRFELKHGEIKLTRIFVVTNKKFNFHAKEVLRTNEPLIAGNIFFFDQENLLNLL